MTILETIKNSASGKGESAMWQSVEAVSKFAEAMKDYDPDAYEHLKIEIHEAMYGPHFDEASAQEAIDAIKYTDRQGAEHTGAHWTMPEVLNAWSSLPFEEGTTDCDKWVAANVMYSDLCKALSEEQILTAAYLFFFKDEDYPCEGKIWHYLNN